MTLKIGISGIRGIVGETLTDQVVADFASAFATYINKGVVVVGRDTRVSGPSIEKIVISSLRERGINVLYAGIVPTPTVQVLVKQFKAAGGIVITASHNPGEWNGFKFISNEGVFLSEEKNEKLFGIYYSKKFKPSKRKGSLKNISDPDKYHINKVLKNVDHKKIAKMNLKVVIDSCNGAGSMITPKLLRKLGCRVISIFTDPDKGFPRGTEPTVENITALCKAVKEHKADIGFAQDPDADRLSVVNEKGIAIGEEYTMVLASIPVLSKAKKGSKVVTNLSTSRMIDDIAAKYGAKVLRSKVGEINVVEELRRSKAVFAGEGNGGVIFPPIVRSRDSLAGIALILLLMAQKKRKISDILNEIPKYDMVKTKFDCSSRSEAEDMLNKTREKFKKEKMDFSDGVKVLYTDSWVHVRASNTEPVIRIIAESPTRKKTLNLIEGIKNLVSARH
jgi:phosphomannomutase